MLDESVPPGSPPAFGPYRVLHEVGIGALGPVFRTYDAARDELAAVKVFDLDLPPQRVADLAHGLRDFVRRDQERRSAALSDAAAGVCGTVRVLDAGVEGTSAFVTTTYLSGETLDALIRREAPIAFERVLPWIAAMGDAIDESWSAGIGHGALHPRDVFINAETGAVVLTGFGLAQTMDAIGLAVPVRRQYQAPERALPGWDRRADIFSLGVIAHELLTGRKPLGTGEQDGVFASSLRPQQRVVLRRALARALAERPAERFPTAAAFVDALRAEPAAADVLARAPRIERRAPSPAALVARTSIAETGGLIPFFAAGALGLFLGSGLGLVLARAHRPVAAPAAIAPSAAMRGETEVSLADAPMSTDSAAAAPAAASPATPIDVPAGTGPEPIRSAEPSSTPTSSGRIVVRSEPGGAMVRVDGRLTGQTPTVVLNLALGSHDLVVARPGHVPHVERVVLSAASPSKTFDVALEPGVTPPPVVRGAIDVLSTPRGARVIVDGRLIGQSPLRLAELRPGTHTVRLELAGHRPVTNPVMVEAGKASRLAVTLAR